MSAACLVTGSWRLRHGEPLAEDEAALTLAPLGGVDLSHRLVRLARDPASAAVPLAILAGAEPEGEIAYLLHALDADAALFMRTGERRRGPASLAERISSEFADWHLRLNNNECYYCSGGGARSTVSIRAARGYWELGHRIYAALDEGAWAPFAPQFRAPPRHWHCDMHTYDVRTDAASERLIATASGYARKRASWRQRVMTAELIGVAPSGEATTLRTGELAIGPGGLSEAMTAFVQRPVAMRAGWRRLAMEIPCESLPTGNLFKLTIEMFAPLHGEGVSHLLASIVYDKTRGPFERGGDDSDHAELRAHLKAEIADFGGVATPCPSLFAALGETCEAAP